MAKRTVKKSVQVLRFLRALYGENSHMSESRANHVSRVVAERYSEHLSPRDVINHFADRRYRLNVKQPKTKARSEARVRPDPTTRGVPSRQSGSRLAIASASASGPTDAAKLASSAIASAPPNPSVGKRSPTSKNKDPDTTKRAGRSQQHATPRADFAHDLPRCTGYFTC